MKMIGIRLTATRQLPLQVRSRHAGHTDVEDQATGLADAIGGEKLFRRGERLDAEAERPDQVGQRLAYGFVIIDDRHEWVSGFHEIPAAFWALLVAGACMAPAPRTGISSPEYSGMEKENVAPGPSFDMAQRRPRWLSMMERLTDSPIPMPSLLVV